MELSTDYDPTLFADLFSDISLFNWKPDTGFIARYLTALGMYQGYTAAMNKANAELMQFIMSNPFGSAESVDPVYANGIVLDGAYHALTVDGYQRLQKAGRNMSEQYINVTPDAFPLMYVIFSALQKDVARTSKEVNLARSALASQLPRIGIAPFLGLLPKPLYSGFTVGVPVQTNRRVMMPKHQHTPSNACSRKCLEVLEKSFNEGPREFRDFPELLLARIMTKMVM